MTLLARSAAEEQRIWRAVPAAIWRGAELLSCEGPDAVTEETPRRPLSGGFEVGEWVADVLHHALREQLEVELLNTRCLNPLGNLHNE